MFSIRQSRVNMAGPNIKINITVCTTTYKQNLNSQDTLNKKLSCHYMCLYLGTHAITKLLINKYKCICIIVLLRKILPESTQVK